MNFEVDYNELLECAKVAVFKRRLDVEPAELVNQSYIKFYDSGKEYKIQEIKNYIFHHAWKEFEFKLAKLPVVEDKDGNIDTETTINKFNLPDKVCIKCKESKPIMCYRVMYRKPGNMLTHTICYECEKKIRVELFRKNREQWNEYMRKRRPKKNKQARPIHELWREANRRYYAKKKEMKRMANL